MVVDSGNDARLDDLLVNLDHVVEAADQRVVLLVDQDRVEVVEVVAVLELRELIVEHSEDDPHVGRRVLLQGRQELGEGEVVVLDDAEHVAHQAGEGHVQEPLSQGEGLSLCEGS